MNPGLDIQPGFTLRAEQRTTAKKMKEAAIVPGFACWHLTGKL
jgi:hypothetical protein